MSKVKALLLAVSMVPLVMNAQNLVKNGDAESNLENWQPTQVQVVTENPHYGKNCFKTTANSAVVGTEVIPVDGTKTYKYSGWFKSADDKKPKLYLALMPLDGNKVQICSQNTNAIVGTETELAEACKPGDTVLKVKDASKWKLADKIDLIAFNVLDDCKDLPNRNNSPIVSKAEKKNNVWELTLASPCGVEYQTGTKIRQHRYASGYMYPAALADFQAKDWKELTGEIKGVSKSGEGGEQFWAGTKYVKLVIFTSNGGTVYFDDIQLEEVK